LTHFYKTPLYCQRRTGAWGYCFFTVFSLLSGVAFGQIVRKLFENDEFNQCAKGCPAQNHSD
jgi:hypothetical protein